MTTVAPPNSPNVLVLGDDMRIFLAIARAFGRVGINVHASPLNVQAPALNSRHVAKIHGLPAYENAPEIWQQKLQQIIDAEHISLVIPCSDPFIMMLHHQRGAFHNATLAIPAPLAIENLFDKALTHQLCENLAIPVSPFKKLAPDVSPADIARSFTFPLILKPRRSYWMDRPGHWGRVYVIESMSALQAALQEIKEPDRYIAEAFFDGVGGGVSVLASRGEIRQAFQHRRLREGLGAASSYRISEAVAPDKLEACTRIIREMNYTGVCMFEFRTNETTGQWILLETNARFWGSMALPLGLGVNFPVLLYDLLSSGLETPPVTYKPGIRSRNITLDAFNLLKMIPRLNRRNMWPWLAGIADFSLQPTRWLLGTEMNDSFAADDMRPGFAEFLAILRDRN